jgi:hypothetical protein
MAVVINEVEVAPQAAASENKQEAKQEQEEYTALPDVLKAVHKLLHLKQQRSRRLEAY